MDNLGDIIKKLREEKKLPLRTVAAYLDIDQAILSKMERGQRKMTRDHVVKLAKYFDVKEEDLLVAWLSDKLVYEIAGEKIALKALEAAEKKVAYLAFKKRDRNSIIEEIKSKMKNFPIEKAWIFGSFSRNDDSANSDIDIAVKADESFSYFDLAGLQYELEQQIKVKVDVGFIDSFKPYIYENIKDDLKLIYEKELSYRKL
jgi:predicted nucleotidyltransferase/plasmid maintenance system antidote protein VapI